MKTDKKICVLSLGCKVNQYDSEGIMARFSKLGFTVSDSLSFADIYIINTPKSIFVDVQLKIIQNLLNKMELSAFWGQLEKQQL